MSNRYIDIQRLRQTAHAGVNQPRYNQPKSLSLWMRVAPVFLFVVSSHIVICRVLGTSGKTVLTDVTIFDMRMDNNNNSKCPNSKHLILSVRSASCTSFEDRGKLDISCRESIVEHAGLTTHLDPIYSVQYRCCIYVPSTL